jgi:hypothetical protein
MSKPITITLTDDEFNEFEKLRNGFTPPMKRTELIRWLMRLARFGPNERVG